MRVPFVAALLLSAMVLPSLGATVEEVSCKADELGVRSNIIMEMVRNLTDAPPVAPIGTSSLGNGAVPGQASDTGSIGVLSLAPNHIGGMEKLQMMLPLDWECQTGSSSGVYPCPDGIPSTCRLTSDSSGLITDSCAACFCIENAHPCCEHVDLTGCDDAGAAWSDAAARAADTAWADGALDAADTWTCQNYRENYPAYCQSHGHFTDETTGATASDVCLVCANATDVNGWSDAAGDTCASFTDNPSWCDKYADSADSSMGGMLVGEACAVCRAPDVADTCPSELADDVWGMQWWEDGTIGVSYVSYKITRYEMNPDFGVEFYSTEGDTTRVYPDGTVHFKPQNAKRSLVLNEQVQYVLASGRNLGRNLGVVGKEPGAVDLSRPLSHAKLQEMRAEMRGQKKKKTSKQGAAEETGEAARRRVLDRRARSRQLRRRSLRRGGGTLMTSGSFTMMSSNAFGPV